MTLILLRIRQELGDYAYQNAVQLWRLKVYPHWAYNVQHLATRSAKVYNDFRGY